VEGGAEEVSPTSDPDEAATSSSQARERILRTAYDLFSRHGVQAVGIDRIIDEAGVAKMTLYRHFRSKDDLAIAVLDLHERVWTWEWFEREIQRRGSTPTERLLAAFDVFDDWFHDADYGGCLFTNSLLESHDRLSPIGAASVKGLAEVRSVLRQLAIDAGVKNPDDFAHKWQMVMLGSIIAAIDGDVEAARRGREVARHLLEHEGPRAG
jgi:AcrR family transcriptional regulator